MKKLTLILAAILVLSVFASCSKKTVGTAQTQTEAPLPTLKAANEVSLAPLASALKESGYLGENTEYMTMGDEYAADVLMFTYGIEGYEALGCRNFLVTEHGSNEAYSCAIMLFDADKVQSAFALISSLYESYARDLEGSVAPYNPEAATLCSKRLIRNLEIKGETGSVSAICLFISDDNAALETLVSDQLTSILSAQ